MPPPPPPPSQLVLRARGGPLGPAGLGAPAFVPALHVVAGPGEFFPVLIRAMLLGSEGVLQVQLVPATLVSSCQRMSETGRRDFIETAVVLRLH
mmetsp:Transcript_40249/g.78684  ORF Transcript_40249/g.78684 Transcript_40249/m.78684 type:complete len:94 (-) Transcript_40249:147-428(-)